MTNNTTLITPTNNNREHISLPSNGVSISSKMAEMLNIEKGETVKWHIYGNETWVETEIVAIYSDPTSQGITISKETFEDLGYNFTPTNILSPNLEEGNFEGITSIKSINNLIKNWDELTESFMLMVYVMVFFAIVLSVVVLYNLGLLSFTESEREIATLKVIGFNHHILEKYYLHKIFGLLQLDLY